MHADIKSLLYEAEEHYLQPEEIDTFKNHTSSLALRLETYELLREQELVIFQAIADQLTAEFPQEPQINLERGLKHWLTAVRYCAMAMVLNSPTYLQHRLLEWLTDLVQVYQLQAIETTIYQLLQKQLEHLSQQQLALIQPFLLQAKTTLLATDELAQLPR